MKAAVFHKIGDISVDNVADPKIEKPDDIVVKVTSTAICSSDLPIYDGFVPQMQDLTMGHEFMGVVEEVGKASHAYDIFKKKQDNCVKVVLKP